MKTHTGIVLKKYHPHSQSIILFDKDMGKIEARVRDPRDRSKQLTHGAHITYKKEERLSQFHLFQVDIIHVPFSLARSDIRFFHSLIELCYYFLPFKSHSQEIFQLVTELFTTSRNLTPEIQQVALCRFFGLLGIHPEDIPFNEKQFTAICRNPFDEAVFNQTLDEETLTMVQSWLLRCIDLHPQKSQFKTFFQSPKNRT